MEVTSIANGVREVEDQFYVKVVDNADLLRQVYELRYQVYCTERNFLPGQKGLEYDEFDHRSRHVALLNRESDELVGTARLVLHSPKRPHDSFPMQLVCDPSLLDRVPLENAVEISRFAISKQRRSFTSAALMRMGLIQGLVRLSAELGVTHWCAVMEPTLLRLLRMTSIYFRPLGPLVDYHGPRQPCFNRLDHLLDAVKEERPEIWSYLTEGGRTWQTRGDESWQRRVGQRVAA